MTDLAVKTKNYSSPQGKQRVYFCCHPDDLALYLDPICEDIFQYVDCAIWYKEDLTAKWDPEEMELELGQMQLFVIPVTHKFLEQENEARCVELPFAVKQHIPILPLIQEEGLEDEFSRICGPWQCFDKKANDKDQTAIPFEEKLERYLSEVLMSDELVKQVREAFDAYIFLSYRKKDRASAQDLMRLIHQNDFCRDIAIWYDEYLTPEEDFNDMIREAMDKSLLVTFAVTPNLLVPGNYVMDHEYKDARNSGKLLLSVEMENTDRKLLMEDYPGMPDPVDAKDHAKLSDALLEKIQSLNLEENDQDPQHLLLIGEAYLNGVDVEKDSDRGIRLITEAAEKGNMFAQFNLGVCYCYGQGVEQDYKEAIKWFKKAAEQGHILAENNLGTCYYSLQDYKNAVYWYEKAAMQGVIKAQINLAVCFQNGQGVEQNYEKAAQWFEMAAQKGDAFAQNTMGIYYHNGLSVEQDYAKAVKWLEKSAEQGYPWAQYNLGLSYDKGEGVERNYEKAVELYEKAAAQGVAEAQYNLGEEYLKGRGVKQNCAKANVYFEEAASQGYVSAQYNLGASYYYGYGVERDYTKAAAYFEMAAEQGHARAQYYLGRCYYYEQGVSQDDAKAVEWFTKSAEQGNADAQFMLGNYYDEMQDDEKAFYWVTKAAESGNIDAQSIMGDYYFGDGENQDYEKSFHWYLKAAEKGDMIAQQRVGDFYDAGEVVEQDEEKAQEWYSKAVRQYMTAAGQGYVFAESCLGICYEFGKGVPEDRDQAIYWYKKAAEHGDEGARERLDDLMKTD